MKVDRLSLLGMFSILCWLGLTVGCNQDGKTAVEGVVTWNGEPVPTGQIIFTPVDKSIVPDAGKIEDGKFAFRSAVGEKTVEIFADKADGPPDPVMHIQRKKQYIPQRYNERTELTADVTKSGDNSFTFDLKEAPGDKAAGSDVSTRPSE